MKSAKTTDRLVARFVESVNTGRRDRLDLQEVPVPCRRDADQYSCDWQIVESPGFSGWIERLEERAAFRFPSAFRRLISGYLFPLFDRGPIQFYAVGLEEDSPSFKFDELRGAVFIDPGLTSFLLPLGLVPFARPQNGDWDQMCFDFREHPKRDDHPIVRIDHEEILSRRLPRLRISDRVAPSFAALLDSLSKP
jgi:hypothetical protein